MLGLLVIIIISWVLLYLIEKKNINALGIIPNKKRFQQFGLALFFIIIVHALNSFIEGLFLGIEWKLKEDIIYINIFNALLYHIKSALTEDLVFRGALLYILIQRLGTKKAIWISALCFGIYHVFSYGISFNAIIPIIYVVVVTGFAGYVWAFTFYKTKSIYMGLGFHLGVNMINVIFYKSQPYGELLFYEVSRGEISEWNNFLVVIFKGLFTSVVTFVCLIFYFKHIEKRACSNNKSAQIEYYK